jgi:hypothetical protein
MSTDNKTITELFNVEQKNEQFESEQRTQAVPEINADSSLKEMASWFQMSSSNLRTKFLKREHDKEEATNSAISLLIANINCCTSVQQVQMIQGSLGDIMSELDVDQLKSLIQACTNKITSLSAREESSQKSFAFISSICKSSSTSDEKIALIFEYVNMFSN